MDRVKEKVMNKRILIPLLIALLLIIGITYAWLVWRGNGEEIQRIKGGTLELELDDLTSQGIEVDPAIPMSDRQGLITEEYEFKVRNKGSINASYKLYLEDEDLDQGQTRLEDQYVRYSITRNGSNEEAKALTTREIDNTVINSGDTNEYTLKIWIKDSATNTQIANKVFKARLRLEAEQSSENAEAYTLSGTLRDSNGDILANVPVVLFSTPKYTTTDSSGNFSISGVEQGLHELYYVPGYSENDLKAKTRDQLEAISGIGKATITTQASNSVVSMNNISINASFSKTPATTSLDAIYTNKGLKLSIGDTINPTNYKDGYSISNVKDTYMKYSLNNNKVTKFELCKKETSNSAAICLTAVDKSQYSNNKSLISKYFGGDGTTVPSACTEEDNFGTTEFTCSNSYVVIAADDDGGVFINNIEKSNSCVINSTFGIYSCQG